MTELSVLRRFSFGCTAVLATMSLSNAALAEDDTNTGLVAGLALTAASGKTTLAAGAGAIEAGLLGTDALDQAGKIVAGIVNAKTSSPVLVIAHDEKLDLVSSKLLLDRITQVRAEVDQLNKCHPQPPLKRHVPAPQPRILGNNFDFSFVTSGVKTVTPGDIAAAALVDTSVSPITLSADDRTMVDAVVMNANQPPLGASSSWIAPVLHPLPDPSADTAAADDKAPLSDTLQRIALSGKYIIPAEGAGIDPTSTIKTAFDGLVATIDASRPTCTSKEQKAALDSATAFASALGTPGASGLTTIASAMQVESLVEKAPMVLRLAIEQDGGTAIARTGLLYTFGMKGAATISSGLLVSFRLLDPRINRVLAIGFVRCAVPPQNLREIAHHLDTQTDTKCAYRATMF